MNRESWSTLPVMKWALPYYYSNSCRSYQPKPWCKCTSRTSSKSATSVGNLTSQNQLRYYCLPWTYLWNLQVYQFIHVVSIFSLYFHMSSITLPWYEMRSCPLEAPHLPRAYLWPKVIFPTSVGPGRPEKIIHRKTLGRKFTNPPWKAR